MIVSTTTLGAGAYARGVVALVVVVAVIVWAAVAVRKAVVPGWWGAPARLAEAIIGLALTLLPAEIAGGLGGFRAGVLVVVLPVTALVAGLVARRFHARAAATPRQPPVAATD